MRGMHVRQNGGDPDRTRRGRPSARSSPSAGRRRSSSACSWRRWPSSGTGSSARTRSRGAPRGQARRAARPAPAADPRPRRGRRAARRGRGRCRRTRPWRRRVAVRARRHNRRRVVRRRPDGLRGRWRRRRHRRALGPRADERQVELRLHALQLSAIVMTLATTIGLLALTGRSTDRPFEILEVVLGGSFVAGIVLTGS